MHFGNKMMPAVIHPTKCCVNHTFSTSVVPHIHPTHTTTVNHHLVQHKHYFPQTANAVNEVSHQHFNCGPGPGPMGQGFGPGPGAMPAAPGFGPGPGMGAMPAAPGGFPGRRPY